MSKCESLLAKARQNPAGLRFAEATALAECWGFVLRRGGGTAHRVYKRSGTMDLLNFQRDKNGKAKRYQVEQLLRIVEELEELT